MRLSQNMGISAVGEYDQRPGSFNVGVSTSIELVVVIHTDCYMSSDAIGLL